MDAATALNRLRELFPVTDDYDTELIMFTNGDVEIEVFYTVEGARRRGEDCQNVTRVEGNSIDECMSQVERWVLGER
jgi:hypothetical protein